MLTFHREVQVPCAPDTVFDYLSDFETTNEWDPRAFDTTLVKGSGGEGSRYRCAVHFLGRVTTMEYEITDLAPPHHIEWVGRNGSVRARDVISLHSPADGQTTVHYTAIFDYPRRYRAVEGLLRRPLARLCDDAQRGLQQTLAGRFA